MLFEAEVYKLQEFGSVFCEFLKFCCPIKTERTVVIPQRRDTLYGCSMDNAGHYIALCLCSCFLYSETWYSENWEKEAGD